jgi:pimeloyl-ACP methyl ester carboxylesterase
MRASIMMIHGMWAGGWVWSDYISIFEERGYRCLAPTLRYHDAPPLQPPAALGRTSLLDYAKDLQEKIEKLDQFPVLMGHSMGGMLAQMLGARGLAKGLVLLSPMPPQGFNVISLASLRMFRETLKRWGFWRNPTRPTFGDAAASMLGHLPGDEQRRIYERLVHESGRVACETGFWFLDRRAAKYVDASHITCPVLLVAGAEDTLHPPAMMRKVARRYEPYSTYVEFPGRGHWLVGDPGWRTIAERIADWLDEKGLKQAA